MLFFLPFFWQLEAKEGCNVYGHMEVPKVAGNIHFAPGGWTDDCGTFSQTRRGGTTLVRE